MQKHNFSIYEAALEKPQALALRSDERDYTFAELAELVRERAKSFKAPLKGPYPLAVSPKLETLVDIYLLLEKQIPIMLLHPGLTESEKSVLLASVKNIDAPLPADCAAILFTSGTTGLPKPAVITRRALKASARSSAANIPLSEGDVWQLSISPARIGGFSILTRSLLARSAVSLPGKFSPERFVEKLVSQKATITSIVPTMLSMVIERFPDWQPPETLRAILLGGSSASKSLREKAAALKLPIIITYGMTETASNVVTTPYEKRYEATEGCGVPNAGVEIRSNDGIIEVKGGMLMDGYWGREPIDPNEWFVTGDIGFLDKAGNVHIQARRTDVILSGGENVYPVEVEEALETIPGIKAARVVGMADDVWGAIVTALLVPEKGVGPIATEAVVEGLSGILARYKSPRRIAWCESLPVLPNGKPDRSPKILSGHEFLSVHYTKGA